MKLIFQTRESFYDVVKPKVSNNDEKVYGYVQTYGVLVVWFVINSLVSHSLAKTRTTTLERSQNIKIP